MIGVLVLAVTVSFPGIKLGLMLVTLLGMEMRPLPARFLKALFRWYGPVGLWTMINVYLLGFLVAYTRLAAIASVHLDTALYSLIGLMVSLAAADATVDDEAVWRALDRAEGASPEIQNRQTDAIIGCHCCGLVNRAKTGNPCRRCETRLRARKTNSFSLSAAFVVAAFVLYIPANIFPVMLITQVSVTHQFTIFDGIVELMQYGLWPLAALVFLASITIPIAKFLTLGYMLITTRLRRSKNIIGRTRAFRLIAFIGRWLMIDVFMISILVALVRFNQIANVQADIKASCFAAVVVLTMFAVECFDPRSRWDAPARPALPIEFSMAKPEPDLADSV